MENPEPCSPASEAAAHGLHKSLDPSDAGFKGRNGCSLVLLSFLQHNHLSLQRTHLQADAVQMPTDDAARRNRAGRGRWQVRLRVHALSRERPKESLLQLPREMPGQACSKLLDWPSKAAERELAQQRGLDSVIEAVAGTLLVLKFAALACAGPSIRSEESSVFNLNLGLRSF